MPDFYSVLFGEMLVFELNGWIEVGNTIGGHADTVLKVTQKDRHNAIALEIPRCTCFNKHVGFIQE